jgi:glycyl-tRNA synthetase beta chain
MIEKSLSLFSREGDGDREEITVKIYAFLKNRMTHMLSEEGFSKDTIQAVMEVSGDLVPDVWARVKALERLRDLPDFEPLAVAFKRVVNIIRQSGYRGEGDVNESIFTEACEKDLLSVFKKVKERVETHLQAGDLTGALLEIALLRKPVDAFFDGVLVMAEDEKIRTNRLAILAKIALLFDRFADFGKITT